jgi:curved DNA-binding protein CbpA
MLGTKTPDYYEFLQISPNADSDTIHRVYRFLAARFHPDNAETGDPEKFFLLKSAYDVLSDPERRTAYDAGWERQAPEQPPLSTCINFMDQVEGEQNRRLALLTLLYHRRRTCPYAPEVSLTEIEARMGFPRDYLDFTTWYLVRKEYITRADNSDFTLTAQGVDFVEKNRGSLPILNRLLTSGTEFSSAASAWEDERTLKLPDEPVVASPEAADTAEPRLNRKDRRRGSRDQRTIPTERRASNELVA